MNILFGFESIISREALAIFVHIRVSKKLTIVYASLEAYAANDPFDVRPRIRGLFYAN